MRLFYLLLALLLICLVRSVWVEAKTKTAMEAQGYKEECVQSGVRPQWVGKTLVMVPQYDCEWVK